MRPDIGKEYFEGDIKDMITNITSHVLNITNYDYKDDIVEKYETIEKIVKIKKDPTIVIMEYVDKHREYLSENTFKSHDFYENMITWIDEQKYNTTMNHNSMIKDLIKSYNINHISYPFTDGLHLAITFPKLIYEIDKIVIHSVNCIPNFVKKFILKNDDGFFTLKEAKERFKNSPYFNGKMNIKNELQKLLKIQCIEEKQISGRKYYSIFMGYSFINDDLEV